MMNNIHRDVLDAIVTAQLNRYEAGETLTDAEMAEVITIRNTTLYMDLQEAGENAIKFGNMLLTTQKDYIRTRRIYDLFLQNHGLSEEFENFYYRILNRLYRDKEA